MGGTQWNMQTQLRVLLAIKALSVSVSLCAVEISWTENTHRNSEFSESRKQSRIQLKVTMSSLSQSISGFSLELFKTLEKDAKTSNVSYSPFSIATALSMVLLGARGETAAQMEKVLHFVAHHGPKATCAKTSQDEAIHQAFKELLSTLNKPNQAYELSVANRLYGDKKFAFSKDYILGTEKFYNATLESVDFKHNAESAREKINLWIESQTKGKIKNLFAKGSLTDSTKMALVNAIYFKGTWMKKFNKDNTKDAPFYLNKKDKVSVKMMFQKEKFQLGHLSDLKCRILGLPYKGGLSMNIILPDEIDGLAELETKMTPEKFAKLLNSENMQITEVLLHVPQFKLEQTYNLEDVLASMGITKLFKNADLSGITKDEGLQVSKVIHKCFIDVNEEGTEAAAATGVTMVGASFHSKPPVEIKVDHPFWFFIKHDATNSLLFFGKVMSP